MRTPADVPRRDRVTPRGRAGLIVAAAVVVVLLASIRGVAGFWTDYLWFDALGFTGVWVGVLGAKLALGAVFTAVFFALCWTNLFVADRIAPRFRPAGPEEDVVERYHEMVGDRVGWVRVGLSALLAFIAGIGVSARWEQWVLFTNAQDFGVDDPQFGVDVGFYVFRLPFLTFLVDWAFAAMVIVLVVTAAAHYLNGGIRVQTPGQRVTPQVKAHLSVLLGLLALLRAGGYFLERFELTLSERGVVRGATYTDVNAQLPALTLLILISLFAFLLFLWNIRQRGWVLPVIAVGLWVFVALVVGGLYPAFIQRFRVEPAESTREAPFIERNIAATRAALGLDEVEVVDYDYNEDLEAPDLLANEGTIRNVRLLDPGIVDDTYQRLQGIRTFYEFPDLDVDRYEIDGRVTQVVLSARELSRENLPQSSWEAEHLAYTHGYGAALSPANAVTAGGRPDFLVGGLPPEAPPGLELDQPAIYFGEAIGGYSIVDSARQEINFVAEDGSTDTTTYAGRGGVGIGSYLRRAAFALRFGDINPLISDFLEGDSRILYMRDVQERVEAVAPFLHFDADPYPVIHDGGLVYVVDAYTTSSHYPYAETADAADLPAASGLDHGFNYVRNSVKAVVDAYHGDVTLYVMDEEDPVLAAYRSAFPDVFTARDEMPEALRDNLRYPEDLFRTQTTMWGRYHIDNAAEFYEQSDAWNVAQDPGTEGSGAGQTTAVTNAAGIPVASRTARIDPYYLLMRVPGEEQESFVILRPFVPFSEEDRRNELSAFMTAKSEWDEYGRLQTFVMPRGELPDGPAIVAANIASNEEIARTVSLLDQRGSQVRWGNLLVIPVEESLLWVRPLYVQASGQTAVPELRNVVVTYGGDVVMENTLQQALVAIFGEAPETQEDLPVAGERPVDLPAGEEDPADTPDTPDTTEDLPEGVPDLLEEAEAAFEAAEEALRNGDLSLYQQEVERARDLVARAAEETQAGVDGAPATTTTTAAGTA